MEKKSKNDFKVTLMLFSGKRQKEFEGGFERVSGSFSVDAGCCRLNEGFRSSRMLRRISEKFQEGFKRDSRGFQMDFLGDSEAFKGIWKKRASRVLRG